MQHLCIEAMEDETFPSSGVDYCVAVPVRRVNNSEKINDIHQRVRFSSSRLDIPAPQV